jgi:hypothetical protein
MNMTKNIMIIARFFPSVLVPMQIDLGYMFLPSELVIITGHYDLVGVCERSERINHCCDMLDSTY